MYEEADMEKNYYVCTGCGLLCDDIEVESEKNIINKVYTACRVGVAHMKKAKGETNFLINNKPVDEATAVREAASILKNAKNPLIFGLGTSTDETQKLAIELAKKTNATLDDTSSFCLGPLVEALLQDKLKTCTLEDIRNKADVIIFWGQTHLTLIQGTFRNIPISPEEAKSRRAGKKRGLQLRSMFGNPIPQRSAETISSRSRLEETPNLLML